MIGCLFLRTFAAKRVSEMAAHPLPCRLLINFTVAKLIDGVKRLINSPTPRQPGEREDR